MSSSTRPVLGVLAGLIAMTALPLATGSRPAHGGRADYVGARACATCHAAAYKIWQGSAHARADTAIGATPSPACLACHTTGEAPASRPFLAAVQCEACHGPGAGYAVEDIMRDGPLARRLGLRDLSTPELRARLCRTCHDAGTRLTPFDAEKAYRAIRH